MGSVLRRSVAHAMRGGRTRPSVAAYGVGAVQASIAGLVVRYARGS